MSSDGRPGYRNATVLTLSFTACFTLLSYLPGQAGPGPGTRSVPKARCGPGSRTENGLQGQTTAAERFSGASKQAYNCNLELVGQFKGEGANWDMAMFGNCAYVGTLNGAQQQRRGTVVLDASDPRHLKPTAYLDSVALIQPNETLVAHTGRKLLAGTRSG